MLGHTFWSCPSLRGFGSSIFQSLSAIPGKTLQPDPLIAIFGVVGDELKLSKMQIAYASLHARRLILLNWRGKNSPFYVHWIREVMLGLALEKIRCTVHGSEDKYDKTWSQFITHIKSLPFTWPLVLIYLLFFLSFSHFELTVIVGSLLCQRSRVLVLWPWWSRQIGLGLFFCRSMFAFVFVCILVSPFLFVCFFCGILYMSVWLGGCVCGDTAWMGGGGWGSQLL